MSISSLDQQEVVKKMRKLEMENSTQTTNPNSLFEDKQTLVQQKRDQKRLRKS